MRPNWLDAPNIVLRIGVTATMGTTATAATIGASMPSTGRSAFASAAHTIANTDPATRPMSALLPVICMAFQMIPARWMSSFTTATGLGRARGAILSTSTTRNQISSSTRPTTMGATIRSQAGSPRVARLLLARMAPAVIFRSPSRPAHRAAPRARP